MLTFDLATGLLRDDQGRTYSRRAERPADVWHSPSGVDYYPQRQPEPAPPPEVGTPDEDVGLADYGKAILAGGASFGQSIGWLMRHVGPENVGGAIEQMGKNAVDYWNDKLSEPAKQALSKSFIQKNPTTGEYEWGKADLNTLGLFAAESLLPTGAGLGGGAIATRALQGVAGLSGTAIEAVGKAFGAGAGLEKVLTTFGNPLGRSVLDRAVKIGARPGASTAALRAGEAAAKKLKVVDEVLGAVGFGAGEGAQSGVYNAMSVDQMTRAKSHEELMAKSDRYRQVYESVLPGEASEEERRAYAMDTVASEASSTAGWQSGLTTAILGAPAGAFFGGVLNRSALRGLIATPSRARGALVGVAAEASQETAQSGLEQFLSNKAIRDFVNEDQDLFQGVLDQAVAGGLAGGLLGGVFGAGEAPHAQAQQAGAGATAAPAAAPAGAKPNKRSNVIARAATLAQEAGAEPAAVLDVVNRTMKGGNVFAGLEQLRAMQRAAEEQASIPDIGPTLTPEEAAAKVQPEGARVAPIPEKKGAAIPAEPVPVAAAAAPAPAAVPVPRGTLDVTQASVGEVHGMPAKVEQPVGHVRTGTNRAGKKWEHRLSMAYGALPGTTTKDGEEIDAWFAPTPTRPDQPVFVVNQVTPRGFFDEPKVVFGFDTRAEAEAAFRANNPATRIGSIAQMTPEAFRTWAQSNPTDPAPAPEPMPQPEEVYARGPAGVGRITSETKRRVGAQDVRFHHLELPSGTRTEHRADALTEIPREEGQAAFAPAPAAAAPKPAALGARAVAYNPDQSKIDVQYELQDAAHPIASHDAGGAVNPAFTGAQPRDRSRPAMRQWITETAARFQPAGMVDAATTGEGAPIVGPDNQVESGNGRVLLLREVYAQGRGAEYKAHLAAQAERFGLTREQVEAMEQPILVRRRTTPMSEEQRAQFALAANKPAIAGFSATEQANADASIVAPAMYLLNPSDDGNMLSASNEQFVRAFLIRLPAGERAALMTSSGGYSKQLADRLRAAVFATAYRDDRVLGLMAEEADPDVRNIVSGLTVAAPAFAQARDVDPMLAGMDVVSPLLEAVEFVRGAKRRGRAVPEELGQLGMFSQLSPEAVRIATFIDANNRSAKRMGEAFTAMAETARGELERARGASLFGESKASLAQILDAASRRMESAYGGAAKQSMLLSRPQAPQPEAGEPFIVYRLGRGGTETLENRNAGEAEAVALHLLRNDAGDMPVPKTGIGDTMHAFLVRAREFRPYVHLVKGQSQGGAGVGTMLDGQGTRSYSFGTSGYEATYLHSIPLSEVRATLKAAGHEDFDAAGIVAGARAIRDTFRERGLPEDHPLLRDTSTLPGREPMRERIAEAILARARPAPTDRKPIAYLMGGGSAAGKGSLLSKLQRLGLVATARDEGAVMINPDDAKTGIRMDSDAVQFGALPFRGIPEYASLTELGYPSAAMVVHEESSLITDRVLDRAVAMRADLVIDKTLANPAKAVALIGRLRAAGYEVQLYGVTVRMDIAVERARLRAISEGREVPSAAIESAHRGFSAGYEDYKHLVDYAALFNTEQKDLRLVAEFSPLDNIDMVEDNGLYADFKAIAHPADADRARPPDTQDDLGPEAGRVDAAREAVSGGAGSSALSRGPLTRLTPARQLLQLLPLLSRPATATAPAAPAGGRLTAAGVRKALAPAIAEIEPLLTVTIHEHAPAHLPGDAEGGWIPGTSELHLFADRLGSAERAATVLVHEAFGHFAMEQMPEFARALEDLKRAIALQQGGELGALARELRARYENPDETTLAKETIAALVERSSAHPLVNKFTAAVRAILRRLGIKVAFSENDVRALVVKAARTLRRDAEIVRRFDTLPAEQQDALEQPARAEEGDVAAALDALVPPGAALDGALLLRAYHGSPHSFERFDVSKIGTGEGAQAYGWGLYFAENEETAGYYHRVRAPTLWFTAAGEPIALGTTRWMDARAINLAGADDLPRGVNPTEHLRERATELDTHARFATSAYGGDTGRIYSDAAERLRAMAGQGVTARRAGGLYEVEIPDEAVSRMLDWDKPMSAQPPGVAETFERLAPDMVARWKESGAWTASLGVGALYKGVANTVADRGNAGMLPQWARDMNYAQQGQKIVSLALLEAGVPGIRYLDQGSRDTGAGTRNLVLFDDSLVKITDKTLLSRSHERMPEYKQRVARELGRAQREAELIHEGADRSAERGPAGGGLTEQAWQDYQRSAAQAGVELLSRRAYSEAQIPLDFLAPEEAKALAQLETRPETNTAQVSAGANALRDLVSGRDRQAGATVLANAIPRDFAERGATDLIGQKIAGHEDLAILAQVYRDPRFETLRVFGVDDEGRVVYQTGLSARLPSSVAFKTKKSNHEALRAYLADALKKSGASGYWLLHNHPAGLSTASQADISFTAAMGQELPGLRGHVVIDQDQYDVIEYSQVSQMGKVVGGTTSGAKFYFRDLAPDARVPETYRLGENPTIPSDYLGLTIGDPKALAAFARQEGMAARAGIVTIIGVDSRNQDVRAVVNMPEELLREPSAAARLRSASGKETVGGLRPLARLRRIMTESGSGRMFAITADADLLRPLIDNGILTDAIVPSARSLDPVNYTATSRAALIPLAADERGFGAGRLFPPAVMATEAFAGQQMMFSRRARGTPAQEAIIQARMAKADEDVTIKDRLRGAVDRLRATDSADVTQGLIDSAHSLRLLEEGQFGGLLDARESAYKATTATRNVHAIIGAMFKVGVPELRDGTLRPVAGRKGFAEIFRPLVEGPGGNRLHLWEAWASANRAKRLITEGRESNFTQPEIDELLRLEQTHPDFRTIQREWATFNKQLLDLAESAGAIDPAVRRLWEHEDYVPFIREITEELERSPGKAGVSGQKARIKVLTGRDEKIGHVLENMVQNMTHLVDVTMKNEAMGRIVALGDGIVLDELHLKPEAVTIDLAQLARALRGAGFVVATSQAGALQQVQNMTAATRGKWAKLFRLVPPLGPDVVTWYDKGKARYYRVDDPLLLRTIQAMRAPQFGALMRVLSGPKRLLTWGVTKDPAFMLRNLIRDTMANYVQSEGKMLPVLGAIKGFKAAMADDPDALQIMLAGRGGGGFYDTNPRDVRRLITRKIGNAAWDSFLPTVIRPSNLVEAYNRIGNASEQANRVATYRRVLAGGGSVAEAAYQAQDVLNFSMAGDWAAMQFLIQTVPFMNARVQGLYRLYRGAKEHPWTFAAKGAGMIAATLALLVRNADRPEYDELDDYDKDAYWHFFLNEKGAPVGDGDHWRLPKPFEVGIMFATIPERMMRLARGDDDLGLFADRMGQALAQTLAFNPTPQAVAPLIEEYANRDMFTGAPIVGQAEQGLLPEAQYTARTSVTAREIAGGLGSLRVGDNALVPAFLRSPERIQHLIEAYMGTLGIYALETADKFTRGIDQDFPDPPRGGVYTLPVVRSFVRDPNPKHTRYNELLYDMLDEANDLNATISRKAKEGETEEAARLLGENAGKLQVRLHLVHIEQQVRKINQAINLVTTSDLGPDAKRARIEQLVEAKNAVFRRVAGFEGVF